MKKIQGNSDRRQRNKVISFLQHPPHPMFNNEGYIPHNEARPNLHASTSPQNSLLVFSVKGTDIVDG